MRRGRSLATIATVVAGATLLAISIAPAATTRGGGSPPADSTTSRYSSPGSPPRRPATMPSTTTAIPTTTTSAGAVPPYQVQDLTITLVDPSRETPARGDVPVSPSRVLVTVIHRPVGVQGPMPLVVFAHGWNSDPGVYAPLLDAWAAAGFLVAAPTFPDSADTYPGSPVSDFADQARDLSFVISSLLGGQAGAVDPNRIAVAGHSDGGSDVDLLALDPVFADHRIHAYLSMSGDIEVGLPGPWGAATPGDFEAIVGSDDQYGELPKTQQAFETADMPKVLVTVAGGDHLSMYVGSSSLSMALRQETVRFLTVALGPSTATSAQLASASVPTGDPAIAVTGGS